MLNDSDMIAIVGGPVEGFTAGLRVVNAGEKVGQEPG